jgi:hypothetical protein
VQEWIHHQRCGVGEEERVAVGRRAADLAEGDDARRAGLVVDEHRRLPRLREALADAARDDVGADADGIRHDDADRAGRKDAVGGVRPSRAGEREAEAGARREHGATRQRSRSCAPSRAISGRCHGRCVPRA